MEHQVLARKWRPRTFEQMVGQEHVLKALVNALDQDRLHHAYLFTGTRGVGKTTIARILAKCLNCEAGVSSKPCNQCPTCTEINEGRCVDLIEVDAASRTKVEDTRELLDNVQYAPTRCRFKVYLIDEVHMLSSHSFNALLKTLEEPPPHIKFLLATTDPQKLPVTILSRCLQFNLKNLAPERIVEHLKYVLAEEQINFDEPALWHLGRAADGSMRDALSLTDQAISYGENSVHEADVGAMLGSIDRARVYHLVEALIAQDAAQLMEQVSILAEFSPDYLSVLDELIAILHRIAVAQAVPGVQDNSFGDQEKIQAFASNVTAEDLQLYYQIALLGRRDLPLNPDLRAGLEMVLLRILAFTPEEAGATSGDTPPKKKLKKSDNVAAEEAPGRLDAPQKPNIKTDIPVLRNGTQAAAVPEITPAPRPKLDLVVDNVAAVAEVEVTGEIAAPEPQVEREVEPASEPQPEELAPDAPAKIESDAGSAVNNTEINSDALKLDQLNANQDWIRVVMGAPLKGMSKNILMQCAFRSRQEHSINLVLDPQYIDLLNDAHRQRIGDALKAYFGVEVQPVIESGKPENETPMAYQQRIRQERLAAARTALEQDPVVQQMVSQFDAVLDIESIEPKD